MSELTDGVVTLDLHGKNAYQARVSLDAALKKARAAYRIRVIHGYHNGETLRALVQTEYAGHPLVLRTEPHGEGQTDLILREGFLP